MRWARGVASPAPGPALFLLAPALVCLSADKDQDGDPLPEGTTARVVVWHVVRGKKLLGFDLTGVAVLTPDGKRLVTGAGDTTALVWDVSK